MREFCEYARKVTEDYLETEKRGIYLSLFIDSTVAPGTC
jgi:hypothetical protein